MDLLFGVLLLKPVHQMQFRSDRPLSSCRRLFYRLDDLAGRAGDVGDVVHFLRTLGMYQDLDARILGRN